MLRVDWLQSDFHVLDPQMTRSSPNVKRVKATGLDSGTPAEKKAPGLFSSRYIDEGALQTAPQIADLHFEHYSQTTSIQRVVDWLTAFFGRPGFVVGLAVALVMWVGLNFALHSLTVWAFDQPPFPSLQTFSGIAALVLSAFILATQRRENQLADHREKLTLELAILSDQKSAKIIELLEELRRDSPNVVDRIDAVANVLSKPSDTKALSDAIKRVHTDLINPATPETSYPHGDPST